ncbi:MAG TPA: YjbQ family protein [Hellea balneolensis]|uniref:YjbQ family protein n=1 Tax=Hellea balneolensis TaxID=287478 RepID=A0A7V5U1F8_9PROT|nr:YjbQ family protein [Hellea balneolensis]
MQNQTQFRVLTSGPGLYEFTLDVARFVRQAGVETGLLTLFVRHTSCSLLISENADPDVQADMREFFARLVPENMNWLRHTCEGPDDMPAHIKAALTPVSLSIPITNGQPALGTWQGIYLFEHRHRPHERKVVGHISS